MSSTPCLAITLINPRDMEYAASYHWCKLEMHTTGTLHSCYCGIDWITDDLVEPTAEMILWRTGTETEIKAVSGKLVGYAKETT